MSSSFGTNKCPEIKLVKHSVIHSLSRLCITLFLYGVVLCSSFIFYFSGYQKWSSNPSSLIMKQSTLSIDSSTKIDPRTNINHLVFGIVGSEATWHKRKGLGEAWWRPNSTRGYLYLEKLPQGDLLPWSSASPPFRVSDDLTAIIREIQPATPNILRFLHAIVELMREEEGKERFRWLVMGDDDTVFFVDNLVDVLAEYDHTKFYYIGGGSETILSNFLFSFNMAYGGGGFVLSYSLAKSFTNTIESCLRRYPRLFTADLMDMACIADLGVDFTHQKGFHQIDARGDIFGLLSSNLMSPMLSLHHFDYVQPIFPYLDKVQAVHHLMKAANADQSRLMRQTICHDRRRGWSVTVSWGYSVHIYEKVWPRSWLQLPIQTFLPWLPSGDPPTYMFNTRLPSRDPCEAPHIFFLELVEKLSENTTLSGYYRFSPRGLPPCVDAGHSAEVVTHIHVHSPATKRRERSRSECCDIDTTGEANNLVVKFRECATDEILG